MGFCGGGGGGVVVKCGGKQARLPPRGGFVVVVVVAADKESGGSEGGRRRQDQKPVQNLTPTLVPTRRPCSRAPRQPHKALHAKARGKDGMPDVVAVSANW